VFLLPTKEFRREALGTRFADPDRARATWGDGDHVRAFANRLARDELWDAELRRGRGARTRWLTTWPVVFAWACRQVVAETGNERWISDPALVDVRGLAQTKALSPVIDLPTISVFISRVPSKE
jgi:hypothetical protein